MPFRVLLTGRFPPFVNAITLSSIPLLITYLGAWLQWNDTLFGNSVGQQDRFDFIVVGGGSAGCVVAARLSENPNFRVLLLEAGGNPNPAGLIPLAVPFLQNHSATDWQYKTVPMNGSGYGFTNQQLFYPRGKGLGGSSSTNFMIYMRGNPKDFDRWEELTGDPRWGYKNVEKYFRKMEDYHGAYPNDGLHSQGGPLRVEPVRYTPGLEAILAAVNEAGYTVRDLNAYQQEGFTPTEYTQKNGRRASSFVSYIQPILGRVNLKILRYAHVTKVHFDGKNRAVGVSYYRNGVTRFVAATREVILSAGAINSPQILMLSGIGPKDHLASVGVTLYNSSVHIQTLIDLPVGKNLQDHVTTFIGPFFLKRPSSSFLLDRDLTARSIPDYFLNGKGPLTSPFGVVATGVISTSGTPSYPNLLYTFSTTGVYRQVPGLLDNLFGTTPLFTRHLAPFIGREAHEVLVTLGKPRSRGYVELEDSSPFSKPVINPRYYSDEEGHDLRDMVEGYATAINLYEKTQTLGVHYGADLERPLEPCGHFRFRSREYIECVLKTVTATLFHPVGTCAMGRVGHPDAVVDSQLRVIGTTGLRVADASIMPEITNANTNAPSMMIGEMAADLIKESYF